MWDQPTMTCARCGAEGVPFSAMSHTRFCDPCIQEHYAEGNRAHRHVAYRVSKGIFQHATTHACTDCGKPARMYDHRDYTKTLEVDPVCGSCNQKRGAAYDSVYRPA
jgi:hypothetical protein